MRCDEIQENFVGLLYQEQGTPEASPEVQEHIRGCAACRKELAELKRLQSTLAVWQDEPPLRPVVLPDSLARPGRSRIPLWRVLRYAAIAALVTLAFLGLSNAQIQWNRNGFSFRTSLRSQAPLAANYYTKEEIQTILYRAMNDSEQANFQMMLRMLDTIDQERANEIHILTRQIKESRNRN